MLFQLQEPRYNRRRIVLKGRQPLVLELGFLADFVAFTDISDIDADKVYIAFNEPQVYIPVSRVVTAKLPRPVVRRLLFAWEPDQEGKTLEIYYAGAPGIEIGTQIVTIGADYIGLAKDDTINDRLIPVLISDNLATLDNSSGSATAQLSVFSDDVEISDSGELSVQIALSEGTTVMLKLVRGTRTLSYYLNSGSSLADNSWYEFTLSVISGDKVNVVADVPAGKSIDAYVALILRRR